MDADGWHLPNNPNMYKISELNEKKDYEKIFYKNRWINEDGLEQNLIVGFSMQYRNYQQKIRERQVEQAKKFSTVKIRKTA